MNTGNRGGMRVLLATHFFPPGHLGGTEVLTLGLARALRAAGNSVEVVCAEDWETASHHGVRRTDEVFDGLPVHRLRFNWANAPDVFRCLYDNPEVARQFGRILDEFRPDVLHLTSCYSLSSSVIPPARHGNIPIVLTATDFWFLCPRNTLLRYDDSLCTGPEGFWKCGRCMVSDAKIYRWPRAFLSEQTVASLLHWISRHPTMTRRRGLRGIVGDWEERASFLSQRLMEVDWIVTASQFLRAMLIKRGVKEGKIAHSRYGLDTSWAKGSGFKLPSTRVRIGFIGQILPMKGVDLLLRAVAGLPPELPLQVLIYGDLAKTPDYGRRLQEMAVGDPRIRFLGTFDNARMGEVLAGIDVLAVPSIWYDFPLVIPSALATKTPVLATNLPGMNELIVHGKNGLLFDRYDWQGLAHQITRLVEEPELLDELRKNIEPVKTTDEMGSEYVDLYRLLLTDRSRNAARGAGSAGDESD
jgi:glycosyltransferase involved in cell wall biosynthesis